ncbi:MAG TPA: helix-turn-helix domain-containing protein, partial [Acidimicrobiales bacterium]|nr:helix-turn-helix domain-containing protein [Acidimicrobiales bacterium]
MNRSEIIAYRRRRLLELADELGNVSAACRQMDVDRARYYEWKRLAEQDGVEALSPKPPGRPRSSVPLPPEAVEELLAMAIIDPEVGCAEYASRLSALGHLVSKTTVQEVLQEHGLRHRSERISRAGAASNGAGSNGELGLLTERSGSASKNRHPEAFVPLPEIPEHDGVAKTNGSGESAPSTTAIDLAA